MSFARSFNNLNNNAAQMTPALLAGIDARLLKAVQIRGEFPSSLSLLKKIQSALDANSASLEDLARMICVDHALALRAISIANYEFYGKNKTSASVSEALQDRRA